MVLSWLLKKKRPPVRLTIDQIPAWLDEHEEAVGIPRLFSDFSERMRQLAKTADEQLRILEEAKLDSTLHQRALQLIDGNRKSFIARVRSFIDTLAFPQDLHDLSTFAEDFSDSLEDLNEHTRKSSFVLKEVLEKEALAIGKTIAEMDKAITSLRLSLERLHVDRLDQARKRLADYHDGVARRRELEMRLKEHERKKEDPHERLAKVRERIKELERSSGYKALENVEEELKAVNETIKETRRPLAGIFASLERPMRKYARLSADEATIKKLIDAPIQALIDDQEATEKALDGLAAALPKLDLKERQEEEALETLSSMTPAWLAKERGRIIKEQERQEALQARLKSDTTRMLIAEQRRYEDSLEEQLAALEEGMHLFKAEHEHLSPTLLKQKLREALRVIDESDVIIED